MYTEDDKYSKNRKSPKNKKNNIKKHQNYHNNVSNNNHEDYYQDYYEDYYNDNTSNYNGKSGYIDSSLNGIDTSYSDDYSDETSAIDNNDVNKKKYIVIILLLFIVLSVLVVVLFRTINVKTPPKGGSSNYVRLFQEEIELKVGEKKKLELTLSETEDDYRIEWFSNNDNIVSVDKNGNIEAIREGEAIILVAYYVDDKVYDAQCHVYVLK